MGAVEHGAGETDNTGTALPTHRAREVRVLWLRTIFNAPHADAKILFRADDALPLRFLPGARHAAPLPACAFLRHTTVYLHRHAPHAHSTCGVSLWWATWRGRHKRHRHHGSVRGAASCCNSIVNETKTHRRAVVGISKHRRMAAGIQPF